MSVIIGERCRMCATAEARSPRVLYAMASFGTIGTRPTRSPPASSEMSSANIIPTATLPCTTPSCVWPGFFDALPLVDGQGNFGSIDGDPPPPCGTPRSGCSV